MTGKRIFGIILVLVGVGMILFSKYLNGQIGQGNRKISKAQGQVDTANTLMSFSPEAKKYGSGYTESAQGQINEGRYKVGQYEQLSNWVQIGGIAFIVIGGILILVGGSRKSSRR